jgi:nucleoside-diphosphate-sugar epimerase
MSIDRRVLVTGGTGFVGSHVLGPLRERGFEVHASARHAEAADPAAPTVIWHEADLLDPVARARLIDTVGPSHLLHAAWALEPGKYASSPDNLDWVAASIDLARRFQAAGGRRVVTVGSCFEYEHGRRAILAEDAPLRPSTVYGAAKHALSIAMDALTRATALSAAWARLFYLYGPREDRRRLVADIASSLLDGREVGTGEGRVRRDYMFVADAGAALAALLDSEVTGPVNVATGDAPPVRELVELVAATIGRPELVRFGARPTPPSEPDEIRADVARLRDEVGWTSLTPTEIGVARTVDWWRTRTRAAVAR